MRYFIGGNASVKIVHDRSRGRQRLLELIKKQPVNKFPRVVEVMWPEAQRNRLFKPD